MRSTTSLPACIFHTENLGKYWLILAETRYFVNVQRPLLFKRFCMSLLSLYILVCWWQQEASWVFETPFAILLFCFQLCCCPQTTYVVIPNVRCSIPSFAARLKNECTFPSFLCWHLYCPGIIKMYANESLNVILETVQND